MKKIVLICCVLSGLILFTGCKNSSGNSKPQEESSTASEEIETIQSTNLREKYSFSNEDIPSFLREFGSKFVNFSSIDSRNESVKKYLTEECISANGMNQSVNADFQSKGEITSVYKQTESTGNYLIIGTENMKNNQSTIVIEAETTTENDEVKISKLTVNYMRQAY